MSKEYWGFEEERGDTGFLAGVVDVLSDELSLLMDYVYSLDADIFHLKDNDMSLLNDAVKKRLHYYNIREGCNVETEAIDALDFQLKKSDFGKNEDFVGVFSSYSSASKEEIAGKLNAFFTSLNWYLQKPTGVYIPEKQTKTELYVLGKIYLYMAYQYFFIAYDEYLVLFVFGTTL